MKYVLTYRLKNQSELFSDPKVFVTTDVAAFSEAIRIARTNGYTIVSTERIEETRRPMTYFEELCAEAGCTPDSERGKEIAEAFNEMLFDETGAFDPYRPLEEMISELREQFCR